MSDNLAFSSAPYTVTASPEEDDHEPMASRSMFYFSHYVLLEFPRPGEEPEAVIGRLYKRAAEILEMDSRSSARFFRWVVVGAGKESEWKPSELAAFRESETGLVTFSQGWPDEQPGEREDFGIDIQVGARVRRVHLNGGLFLRLYRNFWEIFR